MHFGFPPKGFKRTAFYFGIILLVTLMGPSTSGLFRTEESLQQRETVCGILKDYYHDREKQSIARGSSSWHLILSVNKVRHDFKINSVIDRHLSNFKANVGANACVEFIPGIFDTNGMFITNVILRSEKYLNEEEVKKIYLAPISFIVILSMCFSVTLIFVTTIRPFKK
ncbi:MULTISPECIES: hypothetical protein [unclassified Agarivorans]|uniref:hypothetical protein n=1 Tax=unclassified Agarivorans TaxID=2636026 RepID=UPI0026E20324|nr:MULTISPECIES: hypothetical protein [unclassified Agarivorans]MDO6685893.1 hypothetical protein [Agarivorans sp. 3_MG-2023]MDO6713969.1 hypothetical protein [Agarivorans sp. 2_MG-2023]